MAGVFGRAVTHLASASTIAFVVSLAVPSVTLHEGTKTEVYLDPVGIPTACTGHTGSNIKLGQRYTIKQCEQFLVEDLTVAAVAVDRLVKVQMTTYQHAALSSFVFNVGQGNFAQSTVLKLLNAGDALGACAQLSRWVYAKGKKLPGLVKRRAFERAQCEKGLLDIK